MKKNKKTVGTMLFCIVGLLFFNLNMVSAQVNIINHGGASLPRDYENNAAFEGESWDSASANWMLLLQNGGTQLGVNRSQVVRKHDLGDYREMITTTSVRTWKGMDDTAGPTVEWGNRWHQGVQIIAQPGTTFIPSQVSVNVKSFTDSGPGAVNTTVSFSELNFFRLVLNPDGTISSTQNPGAPAHNFLYGGIGVGVGLGGSGTTQERLDATANHWWNQGYYLEYTVTVPYTSSEGSGTATSTWTVGRMEPIVVVDGNELIITNTAPGKIYEVQNSPTLTNWQLWQTFNGGSPVSIEMTHRQDLETYPKMFYRVKY